MNMVMLYIVCNQREVEEEKKKKRESRTAIKWTLVGHVSKNTIAADGRR